MHFTSNYFCILNLQKVNKNLNKWLKDRLGPLRTGLKNTLVVESGLIGGWDRLSFFSLLTHDIGEPKGPPCCALPTIHVLLRTL